MKRASRKTLSILSAAAFAAAFVLVTSPAGAAGSGRYIVVLKDSVSSSKAVASEHARAHRAEIGFTYSQALKGYSAVIPDSRLSAIRSDSRVKYVVTDGVASVSHHRNGHGSGPGGGGETTPPPPTSCPGNQTKPWGIDRIGADENSKVLAGNCLDETPAVTAYVIDTGIDGSHPDLKVTNHVNFAGGSNTDCHGHGTHVAGTVAARDNTSDVVGVTPGLALVGVKVLNCAGSGSWSGVIAGIDWVTTNAATAGLSVANMSLGGSKNQAVDDAVIESADSGVLYAVAAGNDGRDACNYSPAWAGTHSGVITVAATDSRDRETSWSNYGSCVDIWAPGASILSTKRGGGTTTMSGTSMASPHVAGGAALYRFANQGITGPTSAGVIESALKSAAESLSTQQSKGGNNIQLLNVRLF